MSAVAIVVSRKGAILLSDGLGLKIPEGELHLQGRTLDYTSWEVAGRNRSKLMKINSHVGITWTGLEIPRIQDSFKQTCTNRGLIQPDQIAKALSDQLKQHFEGQDIASLAGTPGNVNIGVTGYDREGRAWGINLTCNPQRPLEPDKHELATGGLSVASSIPFIKKKDSPFPQFLNKYNDCNSIEEQAVQAFTDMIRTYEDDGKMVGGKIFVEKLVPITGIVQRAGFGANDNI